MQITLNLPHVFNPNASSEENAYVLSALLECLIAINVAYRQVHSETPTLYKSGVRYGRTTLWEPIPALYARGYGDCKSLACALIAEYRLAGIPARPSFRWARNPLNGTDYHIVVQNVRGFEDPSKVLGMGSEDLQRFDSSITTY